jgi:hypothetical protein
VRVRALGSTSDVAVGPRAFAPKKGLLVKESIDRSVSVLDCRAGLDACFESLLRETARRFRVDSRALRVRTLLYLPRVASPDGFVALWQVKSQITASARELHSDAAAAASHMPVRKLELTDLSFQEVHSSRVEPILMSLHYLKSARQASQSFALVDLTTDLPVTLCTTSPLQWKCVASHIYARFAVPQERIWDVARVYSSDAAPVNAISYLLARVRARFRREGRADLLVTAVDPNVGFTGCSYRAANWQHWMSVKARPYLYFDGQYISPRQLRERFGTSNITELQARYPRRLELSRVPLLDSMIFCCSVKGETRVVPIEERYRRRR